TRRRGPRDTTSFPTRRSSDLDADRQFWAFKKPVRLAVPDVKAKERVRNPIDAFLLAALEKKGLSYSPEAERVALLRRATFDLTRSEEHTSELQSRSDLVCRLL